MLGVLASQNAEDVEDDMESDREDDGNDTVGDFHSLMIDQSILYCSHSSACFDSLNW